MTREEALIKQGEYNRSLAGLERRRRYRARRAAAGLCRWDGCSREATKAAGAGTRSYKYCEKHGRHEAARRLQRWQVSDAQDLSAFPNMARGERNGLRYVSFFAPWPAKTKHTRTALTAKPGFRPLTTPAKKYQQFLAQAVLVNGLNGWIRPGTEYILEVIVLGHRSDADQFTGGMQDDLVKSGLMADDKHCEATVSRRYNISKDREKVLFVAVYETEKAKEEDNG